MRSTKEGKVKEFMAVPFKSGLFMFALFLVAGRSLCGAQTAQQMPGLAPDSFAAVRDSAELPPTAQLPGSISGTVVDQSGAVVAGAQVSLTEEKPSLKRQAQSGSDGQFSFANIPAGAFHLNITSAGFATQTFSGVLLPGQFDTIPQVVLDVATNVTEVQVGLTQVEVAEEQIKVEEQQRIFGAIPNFYVVYTPNPVPLTSRQKFEIAWKTVVDPVTGLMVAGAAGVEQAQNHFNQYGQGAQGYAKRFGAGYADTITGVFIGGAVLPSLLKQDPRYFYKGTGTFGARALYAIAFSVVCKGDNGHWQPNYSNVLGSLAAGGISNLYYPAADRDGAELTFENAAIGLGATAVSNLLQEFVIRKLTPKAPKFDPANP
jgi:carboxypeptidase family protein